MPGTFWGALITLMVASAGLGAYCLRNGGYIPKTPSKHRPEREKLLNFVAQVVGAFMALGLAFICGRVWISYLPLPYRAWTVWGVRFGFPAAVLVWAIGMWNKRNYAKLQAQYGAIDE